MTIPAPTGITARHQAGWAYLTVPTKRGHSIQLQYNDGAGWHDAYQQGAEYLVPMYQVGETEWRARYTRAGTHGDWAKGRVWMPDGFEQDGDPGPKPPQPPTGLRIVHRDAHVGTVQVAWDGTKQHEDSFWRIMLEDVDPSYRNVRTPGATFKKLEPGRTYGWRLKAVDVDSDGFEHESVAVRGPEFQLDETPPPPPPPPGEAPSPPRQLRVHCITADTAMVEWDANPTSENVTSYLVQVDQQTQREVIGTLMHLSGLSPETGYTVQVRACRDDDCSQPSTASFTTGTAEPNPDPQPPSQEIPAPTGLFVDPIAPGRVEISWDPPQQGQPADTWWLVTVDDGRMWHRSTRRTIQLDVPPGVRSDVGVYAVVDGSSGNPTKLSAIASKAVLTAEKGA